MTILLAERILQTKYGPFTERVYYDGQKETLALVKGDIAHGKDVLCRPHSSCISAHSFNSVECDCREQMELAQFAIQERGAGIIILLEQEGRGNGHLALVASKRLMREEGLLQSEAYVKLGYEEDARSYRVAAEILNEFNLVSITLLSNCPRKFHSLVALGVVIASVHPLFIDPADNFILQRSYLDKIRRGHFIDLPQEMPQDLSQEARQKDQALMR